MPIVQLCFENGVFSSKEIGDVTVDEARVWAAELSRYAQLSPSPIVAVVDALQVGFVSAEARQIFVEASWIANVRVISIAVCDVLSANAAQSIVMRSAPGRRSTFVTLAEARRFAVMALESDDNAQ